MSVELYVTDDAAPPPIGAPVDTLCGKMGITFTGAMRHDFDGSTCGGCDVARNSERYRKASRVFAFRAEAD